MLSRPSFLRRPISSYHPALLVAMRGARRLERRLEWRFDEHRYASEHSSESLPYRVKKHQSVLIRKLGASDVRLQQNKVQNLRRVMERLDGLLLLPGETFSFCKQVGRPTRRRGFLPGMELSRGVARSGIGGGICQASNLIFWLALHSELEVVERHHHSFDPFPDQGRVLPFASGATVLWNYKDLRLRNTTEHPYQLRLWQDAKCLVGDLRSSAAPRYSYSVYEQSHRFERVGDDYTRHNSLWRRVIDRSRGGRTVGHEHLFDNHAEVKYVPSADKLGATSSCPATKVATRTSASSR